MSTIRRYYTELADRVVKSMAEGAVLAIGVESAQVNALAVDWSLVLGMALGAGALALLVNVGQRGIFGRRSRGAVAGR